MCVCVCVCVCVYQMDHHDPSQLISELRQVILTIQFKAQKFTV